MYLQGCQYLLESLLALMMSKSISLRILSKVQISDIKTQTQD